MFTPPSRRWRATLLACGVAAVLSACGGGGGSSDPGSPAPQPDPITVRSSTPAEGATGVARNVRPELTLSRSVAADQVGFSCAGQSVAAQVAGGTTVQVTPAARLLPLAKCQVQVANGPTLTFTTADGAWAASGAPVENGPGDSQNPHVAMGPGGQAMAVWKSTEAGVDSVKASRYVPGSGWSAPDTLGPGSVPQVAMDAAGNAIAVWGSVYVGNWSLFASRYTPAGGWEAAQVIDLEGTAADRMHLAMNAEGDAVVTWMQEAVAWPHYDIYANRYLVGSGWQGPRLLEQLNFPTLDPVAAVGPGGVAMVVWQQRRGDTVNAYVAQSARGGDWSAPALLHPQETATGGPGVVAAADGSFLAHWQRSGTGLEVWASWFRPGVGWGAPTRVDAAPGNATNAQVATDGHGNAVAVWLQDGTTTGGVYASRYFAGGGWSAPVRMVGATVTPGRPEVRMDAAGNALAVWQQWTTTGGSSAYASRLPAGGQWSPALRLGGPQIVDSGTPSLAMDASGSAIAVWDEYDGATRAAVHFNRFD